ncbi:hypothetical protein GE09DRAFT_237525 [Coniochaeta sp. 2T2.1]|nr:hypothetical protein GE09DRAFT_237525 [Coniochaeta sp. 2T2.1]
MAYADASSQPFGVRVCFKDEFSMVVLRIEAGELSANMCFAVNLMVGTTRVLDLAGPPGHDRNGYESPRMELFQGIETYLESTAYVEADMPREPLNPHFNKEGIFSMEQVKEFRHILAEAELFKGTSLSDWAEKMAKYYGLLDLDIFGGQFPTSSLLETYFWQVSPKFIYDPRDHEEFSVLNFSPLFCGTALLNLHYGAEDVGLKLANLHSFSNGMQLYEALRGRDLLPEVWPDMEEAIRVHLNTVFFRLQGAHC